MPLSREFEAFVLEQFRRVADITPKRMFGGMGVYSHDAHFAILSDDTVYLRVDDSKNTKDSENLGVLGVLVVIFRIYSTSLATRTIVGGCRSMLA